VKIVLYSYYPALKTLEQLEHTYLPRVSKYRFSQSMCETIPKMRDSIKNASMSDLKDFLENIRRHSSHIGEIAMKQANKPRYVYVVFNCCSVQAEVLRRSNCKLIGYVISELVSR